MCRWLLFVGIAMLAVGCGKSAPPQIKPMRSSQTGLLGAPLPVGAKLDEQAVDPRTGDVGINYTVSGSASDILKFFDEAMIADGWQNVPPHTKSSRLFTKSGKKLLVMANALGGSFLLIGQ